MTATVVSVNVGLARAIASKSGVSGIDKRPAAEPVAVRAPDRRAWVGAVWPAM